MTPKHIMILQFINSNVYDLWQLLTLTPCNLMNLCFFTSHRDLVTWLKAHIFLSQNNNNKNKKIWNCCKISESQSPQSHLMPYPRAFCSWQWKMKANFVPKYHSLTWIKERESDKLLMWDLEENLLFRQQKIEKCGKKYL